MIVENKEEVPGDVVEGDEDSESTNNLHTTLNWAAAAASLVLSSSVLADAKAAAAWSELVFTLN